MAKITFWWSSFFSYENRFFVPVILGAAILLGAVVTVLLIRNGRKKRPLRVIWYSFGVFGVLLAVIAQINSGDLFNKPAYIVSLYTLTGVISALTCTAMLFIVHAITPKKSEQASEIEKMSIQDLE